MIEKERLQQLIEQGATVYVNNSYQTYELNMSYFVNIEIINEVLYCGVEIIPLEYLFETKEDAEFALNKVEEFNVGSLRSDDIEKLTCLSYKEIIDYFYKPEELDGNHSKIGYVWHIDDLIIYDEPKELNEFKVYDKTYDNVGAFGWAFPEEQKYTSLTRPPNSWCYIEEIGE